MSSSDQSKTHAVVRLGAYHSFWLAAFASADFWLVVGLVPLLQALDIIFRKGSTISMMPEKAENSTLVIQNDKKIIILNV
jgi:hypothetical protein